MADAIEFGIGGNNTGFVAALKDSEKKAKETADKISKEEEKSRKEAEKNAAQRRKNNNNLAQDLGKLTTASGALDVAISKLGGSLKAAGAVSAFAVIGKTIYDAKQEVYEFEKLMRKLGNLNVGTVTGRSLAELEGNVSTIQGERDTNQRKMTSLPDVFIQRVNAYASNAFDFVTTGQTKTADELNNVGEERDMRIADRLAKAKERVLEKDKEITALMDKRIKGNEEELALEEIRLRYREREQKAIDAGMDERIPELRKQRNLEEAATKNRSKTAEDVRGRDVAIAALEARQSREAATMSPEAAERRRRKDLEFILGGGGGGTGPSGVDTRQVDEKGNLIAGGQVAETYNAWQREKGNKNLETQYKVAEQNYQRQLADNAKWERDIAWAKEDSMRSAKATVDATDAELRGQSRLADLTKQRAGSEQAITNAIRNNNSELAGVLAKADALLTKQKAIAAITDPNTGRARSVGQIRREQRAEALKAARQERAYDRMAERDFIIGGHRGTGGELMSGTDILTGQQVVKGDDGLWRDKKLGTLSKRYTQVEGNAYEIDKWGKWNWKGYADGDWQKTVMDTQNSSGRQKAQNDKDSADNAKDQKQQAKSVPEMLKEMSKDMRRTREVVEEWNRE